MAFRIISYKIDFGQSFFGVEIEPEVAFSRLNGASGEINRFERRDGSRVSIASLTVRRCCAFDRRSIGLNHLIEQGNRLLVRSGRAASAARSWPPARSAVFL